MRLKIDWNKIPSICDAQEHPLGRYRQYLHEQGLRDGTIDGYVGKVERYLKFAKTDHPSVEAYARFRETLHSLKMSRSTLNQYGYAIKAYHKMLGEVVEFKRLSPNNYLPLYFTADEVDKIFAEIHNIKHLAMLKTIFYGCLRVSELCNLNDDDIDFKTLTIRINNGKGGRDGIAYITEDCAAVLKGYLAVRPPLSIDDQQPLFYTDYGHRWRRVDVYHMFKRYKRQAGITRRGGIHIFSRHTPATIMVARGCDIRIVQKLLRHRDIRTTLRYAHVNDVVAREWYNKSLQIEP